MALPEAELKRVDDLVGDFCRSRTDGDVTLAYHIRGDRVTLVESRPFFIDPGLVNSINVAQFEYNPLSSVWTLYWYSMKGRRQPYPTGRNRDSLDRLIVEVAADPTGIFFD